MNEVTVHAFNWVDYTIIAIVVASTLISLMRGFISEAISLLTWIVAIVVAFKNASAVSLSFQDWIQSPSIRLIASFILVFVIILIIGAAFNHILTLLAARTGLSGTNRILGMIFGFARGLLLVAILILLAEFSTLVKEPWWTSSQLIPYFNTLSTWLHNFIPLQVDNMNNYFNNHNHGSP